MSRPLGKGDIEKVIKELEDAKYEIQFADAGRPHIQKAYKKVGQAAGEQIVDGFAFDVFREEALDEVEKLTGDFSKTTRKTSLREVKDALEDALENGESIQQAQSRMRNLYAKRWKSRADMIARNEILTASNGGAVESYKQLIKSGGFRIRKIWIASGDACPWCLELNGETVAIEENFIDKGKDAKYTDSDGKEQSYKCDHRAIGFPTLHPNGRCSVGAEVEVIG